MQKLCSSPLAILFITILAVPAAAPALSAAQLEVAGAAICGDVVNRGPARAPTGERESFAHAPIEVGV
jgi:hypothetical protein